MKRMKVVALACLLWGSGCAGCEGEEEEFPEGPAVIQDPSSCVPFEERQDCKLSIAGVYDVQDLQQICESKCKRTRSMAVKKDVASLQFMEYIELEENAQINIEYTKYLKDLKGLEGLEAIILLRIEDNAALESLDGLENLKSARGLHIENNPKLSSLEGLSALESVGTLENSGNGLFIWNNPSLETLKGLESVREVTRLQVADNEELTSMAQMTSLQFVHDTLSVNSNPKLEELPPQPLRGGQRTYSIHTNSSLPPCRIEAFLKDIESMSSKMINSNGLNSPEVCP